MVKDMPNKFSEVTPEIEELAKKCNKKIDEELFAKYDVKRGLRDSAGKGVLKEVFVNVMVKVSLQD